MSANHYIFVAVRAFVMRGQEVIARAKSGKMAQQIAKALNASQRATERNQ